MTRRELCRRRPLATAAAEAHEDESIRNYSDATRSDGAKRRVTGGAAPAFPTISGWPQFNTGANWQDPPRLQAGGLPAEEEEIAITFITLVPSVYIALALTELALQLIEA